MSTPSTRDVLTAARARLDTPDKWWNRRNRHKAGDAPQERCCAEQAIRWTLTDADAPMDIRLWSPAHVAFADVIGATCHNDIFRWNDARGRTHAEVLAAFDKAIAEATA